ncbi:MAG: S53 family peptidase, partial [Rhizomicrobium sp.]
MSTRQFCFAKWLVVIALFSTIGALNARAQAAAVPPRITQAITDSNLITLRGNVHPLARPEYDRGLAPASLPMDHMMLLLKRSPQQEAALDTLLAQQQDRNSPNYHRWLTPAQFGAEFGPSDQDIQAIESWLRSHGFTVNSISNGRVVIDFSGSVGEVQSAFHTEIHRYVLPNGTQHWANSTNPEIPAALAPVVTGLRSLNSFYPKPLSQVISRVISRVPASRPSSQAKPQPMFTFQVSGACSAPQASGEAPNGDICFIITPSDFGAIYDVQPLWSNAVTGTGETIAIANDSNVNQTDISAFRSLMGLSAKAPQVILADGTDPGVQASGDESEAVLDAEWSGAIAPNATIDLVIAPSSNTSFGGDVAAEYIVDNNLAPILSYSFGACEAGTGAFYGPLWQQAAAEGITVLVASGDDGSAGCDAVPTSATQAEPAVQGLQINGLASTPYDVAVGGTDFNDVSNPAQFWSVTNSTSAPTPSARGYVPETAWNESCTNSVFSTPPVNASFGNVSTQEQACNNATLAEDGFVVPAGGSGGVSTVYPKPTWQSGITPSDGARDVPDISLFAATGAISASFYYLCESDLSTPPQSCNLSAIDGVGGTSVSVQVMAGIVALIDQQAGSPQGNINPALYSLAGANTCASAANPSASCIFYDVTTGTNAMPCAFSSTVSANSPNCFASTSSDQYGILAANATQFAANQFAYNAGTGYDLATGLG